jgi:hypothetical protein
MQRRPEILTAVLVPLALACAPARPPAPVLVDPLPRSISYASDVEPILDRRCVTCHSCYNAPCQLKLSAFEGVDRGGSKQAVYSSSRLVHQRPTRLFFDAHSTEGWRALGFHSVTKSFASGAANDSILLRLLDAKRRRPVPDGGYEAESLDTACPADSGETAALLEEHPDRGMPFGFPPLEEAEYRVLATWLAQGAPGPDPDEAERRASAAAANLPEVAKWEAFLNRDDAKHAMTARYLYEHLFLAHISFAQGDPGEFFELVRSRTPSGTPIDVIATVRPYDDPGAAPFYYRLRKIHETIVQKTHMVVEWNDETLARYRELFIEPEWLEPPHQEPLDTEQGANPFLIYAQIPPESRYRFLLDHSEYIVRTFIRGPVCKGQIALDVIQDHFWVLFLDPDADQTVQQPDFLLAQASNLRLPTEEGSSERLLQAFSNAYRDRYKAYYRAKSRLYDATDPEGFGLAAIWRGRRAADAPLLTVYRHFDSASVHKGVLGGLPRTLWVIDYPHLERIYYALVAGFDVFGNVSHQVNVRRYMDYLRIEGELNFLELLPREARAPLLESWYLGDRAVENAVSPDEEILSRRGTRIAYATDDPKRELVERVVNGHILRSTGIAFDPINYSDGREVAMPSRFETHEDILDGFRSLTAPGTAFIRYYDQFGVDVLYVRVRNYEGSDRFFTIVINRWHDNVNAMFGEEKRLDPSKDTMDFLPGAIGDYPNYFFDVAAEEVPEFFDMLANFDGSDAYLAKLVRFGVNRADPRFWETFDWFQHRAMRDDPLNAGLLDLNRYHPQAVPEGAARADRGG